MSFNCSFTSFKYSGVLILKYFRAYFVSLFISPNILGSVFSPRLFFKYDKQSRPYNYTQILCVNHGKYGYIKSTARFNYG